MILKSRNDFATLDTVTLFALNLYNEARGESRKGVESVAEVVMNRAGNSFDAVKSVILQRGAFSWLNQDQLDAYFSQSSESAVNTPGTLDEYRKIAGDALAGRGTNWTGGANHYYNPAKANPTWGPEMKNPVTIGNHKFGYLPFFLPVRNRLNPLA